MTQVPLVEHLISEAFAHRSATRIGAGQDRPRLILATQGEGHLSLSASPFALREKGPGVEGYPHQRGQNRLNFMSMGLARPAGPQQTCNSYAKISG